MSTLWTCPKCGRRFADRDQWHACARVPLDEHLAGKTPEAVAIFRRFAREVERCGPVMVVPEKAGIAFQTRISFASAALARRWVDAGLLLARRPSGKRFQRVASFSPHNHHGTLRLRSPEEVDEEVGRLVAEAYLMGLQRHVGQVEVAPIRSPRLDLVTMSPDLMVGLLRGDREAAEAAAGLSIPDDWASGEWIWLRIRLEQLTDDPAAQPWMPRIMVLREPRPAIVGNAGFHGPPDDRGVAEIGYQVVERQRRKGFATEAVEALIEWAEREHGVRRFRASIGRWNGPSLRIVRKLGFEQTGVQIDDVRGEELVFELALDPL